ncbi:GNAT family N-acetyltransferase [Flavobacterium terrisoli]|uniref:GNAT family N-acetyltransferase n=1 Tax=Flavobacterium terrisoli TaxID=3242195 RepID=UPI0025432E8C|nr:GNAT family N-acetyltransferase [Flavobacterium buctense]
MFKIYKQSKQVTQNQKLQILDLVAQNSHAISAYVFNPESALHGYLTAREVARTKKYLDRLGEIGAHGAVLLITEYNGIIIGYILYHCTTLNEKDIAIASTVVDAKYRNQGILKNMMDLLKTDNDSITLTCFVEKVKIYEKLGFKIMMQQGTQICMYYGNPDDGEIYAVDDDYIDKDSAVQLELSKFQSQYPTTWRTFWDQLAIDCNTEIRNAEAFIKNLV